MTKPKNYQKTLIACYLGFITQAISANFTPLLFLTFKGVYGISLEMIALIPLVFYLTQLLVDLVAVKFADIIGYRTCVIISQLVSALGLVLMAFLPECLPDPFVGILIAVVLYAIGSGLIEVLLSPIVEACPFENKAGVPNLSYLLEHNCLNVGRNERYNENRGVENDPDIEVSHLKAVTEKAHYIAYYERGPILLRWKV